MKKILLLAGCMALLTACKKESEAVKQDEVPVTREADTIAPQDTVAAVPSNNDGQPQTAAPEPVKSATAKTDGVKTPEPKVAFKYASFGTKITSSSALTKEQMKQKYAALKKGDTIQVKFASTIMSVCKKKGCWMKMDLGDSKESFIRFKDYGFFVPLNSDQSPAIVSGKAFLDVISVDELKHYAKDGGKPQEEIDQITQPKVTYAFQADGVLIQE